MQGSTTVRDSELALSDAEFERIVGRVYSMTGIVLQEHKRQMIYSRLSKRLRELRMTSFAHYLDFLDSPKGIEEIEKFTNSVTTNITGFFREAHHFEHLALRVKAMRAADPGRSLKIWSAGCSSGQEPYSIAMTLLAADPGLANSLRILATDLDTAMLERAKTGIYPDKLVKDINPAYAKYFRREGSDVTMDRSIRNCISFKRLNLFENWPFNWTFDFIFCRNVLIYFDIDNKNKVVSRLTSRLISGGFLYLGHSESLFETNKDLKSCGQTIYEKVT